MADEFVETFSCDCIFVGNELPCVELIVPKGGRLGEFNNGRGGLHHFAYRTKSLATFMATFEHGKGRWLYPTPVQGARGMKVNFIAPSYFGVLMEFVEEAL
jgi:lactoylglutathione lyase/methylmalonyl-CoA/ethylmalonyl-CoA epimerase